MVKKKVIVVDFYLPLVLKRRQMENGSTAANRATGVTTRSMTTWEEKKLELPLLGGSLWSVVTGGTVGVKRKCSKQLLIHAKKKQTMKIFCSTTVVTGSEWVYSTEEIIWCDFVSVKLRTSLEIIND